MFVPRTSSSLLTVLATLVLLTGVNAQEKSKKRPMTVEDLWAVKRPGPPTISPDGKWVAVEVTTYSMEENDSTSDIWLLSTDGKTQRQLTTHKAKESGPVWSPDGKHIAFVSKRDTDEAQIYVISPEGGEARQVTKMPMSPSGLKWAPDSKTIYCIAWTWPDTPEDESYRKKDKAQKDSKVKAFIIDDAQYRYWDKWIADGKRPVVFAVDVATGKHKNLLAGVKLPNGNPAHLPPYEPSPNDYDVSPDGKELCFVAENVKAIGLDANHDLFTLALERQAHGLQPVGLKPKNITEDNKAHDTNPVYSPDGKHIAFLRQTIKFFYADRARLIVRNRSTNELTDLTVDFDRSCANPQWATVPRGTVAGTETGPEIVVEVERDGTGTLCAFDITSRKSQPLALSQGSMDRSLAAASNGYVFLRSDFGRPARVIRPSKTEKMNLDHFNDALVAQWDLGEVKEVTFKGADDRDVQMWVVYPPGFDPNKKWPLLQVVHGGPHNGITTDFHFRWNLHLLASRGYVVACVNFHGSSGFGQEFTDSITGDYGTKPMIDILKATDYMEAQPYIDKNRTTCAGASYGGYMMAYLNGHTDRFKAMICHAGVYNYAGQMASDIVRSRQRSLGGFPWEDYARSDKQSANRFAQNFKTPTLVIHGEKDFRVPVTQGFEYYNTLKMKGVPARLIYFPDENHWILKPQNSRLWHQEFFAWLDKYVGHGPTGEAGEGNGANDDFVPLFPDDGVPKGWLVTEWNDLAKPAPKAIEWTVKDGVLQPGKQRGTWLVSEKEYTDFILEFEFKLTERGNSGVALRAPMKGDPAFDGMELQLADLRYNTAAKDSELTGGIYRAIAPTKQVYKPTEWNSCRIDLKGPRLKVTLNGEMIQNVDLDKFDQPVKRHDGSAAPPIKDRPRKGHIGFQHLSRDNAPVLVRGARIREVK